MIFNLEPLLTIWKQQQQKHPDSTNSLMKHLLVNNEYHPNQYQKNQKFCNEKEHLPCV